MFHPLSLQSSLTCNLCFFTAANHEQWGDHIINSHSNIFLPLFPSYESFQDPQLQYQPFNQLQPLQIRPPFAIGAGHKPELHSNHHQQEEKENKGIDPQKTEFQQGRSVFNDKQDVPAQDAYRHNPYPVNLNEFHKCPFCQYLGSTMELLQNHIQSEHTYQDKIYSDLKPVAMGYATDVAQLINLIHQEPQQHQVVGNNTSPQATSQSATIVVQNNFITKQMPPNSASQGADRQSSLEIDQIQTLNPFNMDKEVNKIPDMALGIENAPMGKISLITAELTKQNNDNGITGIVVEKASLKQCHKTEEEKHLKCDFCDKGFKRRDHLKKHTREQYYKCFSISNGIH